MSTGQPRSSIVGLTVARTNVITDLHYFAFSFGGMLLLTIKTQQAPMA